MIDGNELLRTISIVSIPAISAITVHEWSHGWVASLRGDNSAKMLGRLSLNPMKHIDLVGTILIPISLLLINTGILFGWAKPVPINEYALHNPRWDMALIAFAGPLSNLIMAIIWAIIQSKTQPMNDFTNWLISVSASGVIINIFLSALNILPILPLDGGRILSAILPRKAVYYYDQTERYGFYIIFALIISGAISHIIKPMMQIILTIIHHFLNLFLT